jgi:hypothetical protein
MNQKIPNGAYCLFEEYTGGTREGKIVLVQSTAIQDSDFGSGYTIKEYHSKKQTTGESWLHETITLKPLSDNPDYQPIVLQADAETEFKVIGIFNRVIQ